MMTLQNDVELLNVIIDRSRANLGQIQTWQGRATIRIERTREEAAGGTPQEEAASGTITFVYDLNTGKIQSDWALDESRTNLKEWTPRYLARRYGQFNPVCWQFPMKENIIGSSFRHFFELLKQQPTLPDGKITQEGSIVRFWIGPSDDTCNVYEIDLDKGASLVTYQTLERGKPGFRWTLEPQLIHGVWIPHRTTRTWGSASSKQEETIEWVENEIKYYGE